MTQQDYNNKRIREIYRELLGFCQPFIKRDEVGKLRRAYEMVLHYHQPNWEVSGEDYVFLSERLPIPRCPPGQAWF